MTRDLPHVSRFFAPAAWLVPAALGCGAVGGDAAVSVGVGLVLVALAGAGIAVRIRRGAKPGTLLPKDKPAPVLASPGPAPALPSRLAPAAVAMLGPGTAPPRGSRLESAACPLCSGRALWTGATERDVGRVFGLFACTRCGHRYLEWSETAADELAAAHRDRAATGPRGPAR